MDQKQYSNAKYTSSAGYSYKGYITFSQGCLIFNNENEIIAKLDKEEISSFKINNQLFKKHISIRVNGKDHKFQTKYRSIIQIVNFIKD